MGNCYSSKNLASVDIVILRVTIFLVTLSTTKKFKKPVTLTISWG